MEEHSSSLRIYTHLMQIGGNNQLCKLEYNVVHQKVYDCIHFFMMKRMPRGVIMLGVLLHKDTIIGHHFTRRSRAAPHA